MKAKRKRKKKEDGWLLLALLGLVGVVVASRKKTMAGQVEDAVKQAVEITVDKTSRVAPGEKTSAIAKSTPINMAPTNTDDDSGPGFTPTVKPPGA